MLPHFAVHGAAGSATSAWLLALKETEPTSVDVAAESAICWRLASAAIVVFFIFAHLPALAVRCVRAAPASAIVSAHASRKLHSAGAAAAVRRMLHRALLALNARSLRVWRIATVGMQLFVLLAACIGVAAALDHVRWWRSDLAICFCVAFCIDSIGIWTLASSFAAAATMRVGGGVGDGVVGGGGGGGVVESKLAWTTVWVASMRRLVALLAFLYAMLYASMAVDPMHMNFGSRCVGVTLLLITVVSVRTVVVYDSARAAADAIDDDIATSTSSSSPTSSSSNRKVRAVTKRTAVLALVVVCVFAFSFAYNFMAIAYRAGPRKASSEWTATATAVAAAPVTLSLGDAELHRQALLSASASVDSGGGGGGKGEVSERRRPPRAYVIVIYTRGELEFDVFSSASAAPSEALLNSLEGARVLKRSLDNTHDGSATAVAFADYVCLIDARADATIGAELRAVGWRTLVVARIANPHSGSHNFQRRLDYVFTKLHLFSLVQYAKVVYLDTDVVVMRSLAPLFRCGDFCAVMRRTYFNSGVMVVTPDAETFADLLRLRNKLPSYNAGEQGFLNEYFSLHVSSRMFDAHDNDDVDNDNHGGGGGARSTSADLRVLYGAAGDCRGALGRGRGLECMRLGHEFNGDTAWFHARLSQWCFPSTAVTVSLDNNDDGVQLPATLHLTAGSNKPWIWWSYIGFNGGRDSPYMLYLAVLQSCARTLRELRFQREVYVRMTLLAVALSSAFFLLPRALFAVSRRARGGRCGAGRFSNRILTLGAAGMRALAFVPWFACMYIAWYYAVVPSALHWRASAYLSVGGLLAMDVTLLWLVAWLFASRHGGVIDTRDRRHQWRTAVQWRLAALALVHACVLVVLLTPWHSILKATGFVVALASYCLARTMLALNIIDLSSGGGGGDKDDDHDGSKRIYDHEDRLGRRRLHAR
jgi:hypothetical protein